jgi:rSAM-associated Gly-rich repeat protein
MSVGSGYRKVLSVLLPAGTLGMTIMLGSAAAQAAREAPLAAPAAPAPARTAERLAAIRDAVSDLAGVADRLVTPDGAEQLAWGNWGNGGGIGIGIGGFGIGIGVPAWNNWNNGWRNWGNNWRNGWNNWGNGWNNY